MGRSVSQPSIGLRDFGTWPDLLRVLAAGVHACMAMGLARCVIRVRGVRIDLRGDNLEPLRLVEYEGHQEKYYACLCSRIVHRPGRWRRRTCGDLVMEFLHAVALDT